MHVPRSPAENTNKINIVGYPMDAVSLSPWTAASSFVTPKLMDSTCLKDDRLACFNRMQVLSTAIWLYSTAATLVKSRNGHPSDSSRALRARMNSARTAMLYTTWPKNVVSLMSHRLTEGGLKQCGKRQQDILVNEERALHPPRLGQKSMLL